MNPIRASVILYNLSNSSNWTKILFILTKNLNELIYLYRLVLAYMLSGRPKDPDPVQGCCARCQDLEDDDHHVYIVDDGDPYTEGFFLINASRNEHVDCVKACLAAGVHVDVHFKDNRFYESPLYWAVLNNNEDCVEYLIEAGAEIYGALLLMTGRKGNERCVNLILEVGGDASLMLLGAASKGRPNIVDLLIKAGADLSCEDGTVLREAVKTGSVQCIDLLLKAGADVNSDDILFQRKYDIVPRILTGIRKVLQEGIKVNFRNNHGCNALTHFLKQLNGDSSEKMFGNQIEKFVRLLFAAGETIDETTVKVPDYLKPSAEICLMNICRETIRKHLLQMSDVNLFVRVPQLGLPHLMTSYLLHDVTLDDEEEDNEDKDDSDSD